MVRGGGPDADRRDPRGDIVRDPDRSGPGSDAFSNEKHFASSLRPALRTAISGGNALRGKKANRNGATRVPGLWHLGAVSLQRTKSALAAAFRRLACRKGYTGPSFAIARELAHLVYRALRYGHVYTDSGEDAYESRYQQAAFQSLTVRANESGYELAVQTNTPETVAA